MITLIPSCVYSHPEAAKVGFTEAEALAKGYKVKIGKFSFRAIGKALVLGESDGFVKIVADAENDDVIGVHHDWPKCHRFNFRSRACQGVDATPWEIAHSIHPHPSLSEIMGEAALDVDGKAIHG